MQSEPEAPVTEQPAATPSPVAPALADKVTPQPVEPEEDEKPDQKAAATEAIGEVQDETEGKRKVSWDGLDILVPNELPAEVLFDFAELEMQDSPLPMLRLLRTIVGQEAFMAIRARVAEKNGDLSVVIDAINAITEGYGMSLGESSASEDSSAPAGTP